MNPDASPSDTAAPVLEKTSTVPKYMRAAAIDRFGGPEVLVVRELLTPVPGPNDVLIALHTSGVGEWDAWHRTGGDAPAQPRFPIVLGTDGAGTVAACGSRVRRFQQGDEVYAYDYDRRGFYAEYVVVAANHAGRVPSALDLGQAGAIACIGLTALQGIDDALHVQPHESVVVHGASGGVGHLAVQFARLRGARVLGTASGDDGVELVRSLGADEAVDGKRVHVGAAARRFAAGGVDAVLTLVGGDSLERLLEAVRDGGRVAWPNGIEPEPRKRHGIEFTSYDGTAGVREFDRLSRAVEDAKLKVHIGAEFPLAEAAKAHQRIQAGHVLGKLVLRM
jgi:NADPH:quinone reductase-like Zn-dependent oxidoreductase